MYIIFLLMYTILGAQYITTHPGEASRDGHIHACFEKEQIDREMAWSLQNTYTMNNFHCAM